MKNIIAILALFFSASCNSSAQQVNLDVAAFEKAIADSNIQVLDVRTMEEFNSGHLKDAFLADWTKKEQFRERVAALDKKKPVYTYCLSGGRSSAATKWLNENGFQAYNLDGGIAAWKREGKPVAALAEVKQITLSEYQSLIPKDKVVLVDISAKWCPPCKKMKPVIDSLVKASANQFTLVEVDGGEQSALINELKVEAFPTFIIYKNGKETWRKSGIVQAAEVARALNR
jgi:rhodanese-related sulfurtransferase